MDCQPSKSSDEKKRKHCCDPFKCHPKLKFKDLRPIAEKTMSLHPSLKFQSNDRLCTPCRKKVSALPVDDIEMASTNPSSNSEPEEPKPGTSASASVNPDEDMFELPEEQLEVMNESYKYLVNPF